jgi:hypothetical protein
LTSNRIDHLPVNSGLLLFQMADATFGALLLFQSEREVNRNRKGRALPQA